MNEPTLVAIIFVCMTLTCGAAIVLRGPIGQALAKWIASWSSPEHKAMEAKWAEVAAGQAPAEMSELRAQVDDLQRQLIDVQERLDFAERVLTRRDDRAGALPPGRA